MWEDWRVSMVGLYEVDVNREQFRLALCFKTDRYLKDYRLECWI